MVTFVFPCSVDKNRPSREEENGSIFRLKGEKIICPVVTLEAYLHRTTQWRKETRSNLFLSVVKPFDPVSKATIARWLKSLLELDRVLVPIPFVEWHLPQPLCKACPWETLCILLTGRWTVLSRGFIISQLRARRLNFKFHCEVKKLITLSIMLSLTLITLSIVCAMLSLTLITLSIGGIFFNSILSFEQHIIVTFVPKYN